jgi:DNA invertase Pin-like site-specific DNA recombinase
MPETVQRSRCIAYYRVSTARQGRSGLGMEAQRSAVLSHVGGELPVQEFTEIESGRRTDRRQLHAALTACRVHRAVLVIAKLDRLARNVAFASSLMEAGVEFEAVDMPAANRLSIHIFAAVAEDECRRISERTRAALAIAKARGRSLGGFRGRVGTAADLAKARSVRAAKADQRARDLASVISELRRCGAGSLRALAAGLNAQGITAPRGGGWSAAQVRNLLVRATEVKSH